MPAVSINKLNQAWSGIPKAVRVPHNEAEYDQLTSILDELVTEVDDNPDHPLANALEIISVLVEQYDSQHYPMEKASGISVLKYLMGEHGLKQNDLKDEIGSQGVVSEILNGKRQLNTRQIKALSKRFSVSPAVFI